MQARKFAALCIAKTVDSEKGCKLDFLGTLFPIKSILQHNLH